MKLTGAVVAALFFTGAVVAEKSIDEQLAELGADESAMAELLELYGTKEAILEQMKELSSSAPAAPQGPVPECVNVNSPCPVDCGLVKNKCSVPSTRGAPAFDFCSAPSTPCPPTCAADQQLCTDKPEPYCASADSPCPVACNDKFPKKCSQPANGAFPAYDLCTEASAECPPVCAGGERLCIFPDGSPATCLALAEPCPLTCNPGLTKCHAPASGASPAYDYCTDAATPCHPACADDERYCVPYVDQLTAEDFQTMSEVDKMKLVEANGGEDAIMEKAKAYQAAIREKLVAEYGSEEALERAVEHMKKVAEMEAAEAHEEL